MPGTPKEKSRIAKALNAMAGQKILTESPSRYTALTRANMRAAQEEAPEDPEAIGEAAPAFTNEKETKKTYKTGLISKKNNQAKNYFLNKKQKTSVQAQNRAKGKTRDRIQMEEASMKLVDSYMPDRRNKRDVALYKQLKQNEKLVLNKDVLDKKIQDVRKKLGDDASVSGIISELLNLPSLTRLSKLSLGSAIRAAVSPDSSTSKPPSTQDIEDMSMEIMQRIEDIKDFLSTEIDAIDKELLSLQSAAQTSQTDLQDRMTEQIADAIKPSAKKYLSKEQVKTKVATQFIGEGVKDSSTDRYHKMYQSEGVANTGKYNSSDIIYVSSNGARGNRVNPVVDGELQGEFKNIDKAIKAGAAFIMDDYAHLVKTKKYNIGELALGNYVKSKGYKRVGRSGMWTKDGKAPQSAAQGQGPKAEAVDLGVYAPTVEQEVAELKKAKIGLQTAIEMIAPEFASVQWRDIPHSLYTYKRRKDRGSKRKTLTLGMLAESRDFKDIQLFNTKGEEVDQDTRTPQQILWDFVTVEFDPTKGPETPPKDPYYGLVEELDAKSGDLIQRPRTKTEYAMILEAVKASAMFPKKSEIASKPMGDVRLKKNVKTGKMEQFRRGYPSGYMSEKGTPLAAIIAERIREQALTSVKDEEGKRVRDEKGSSVPVLDRLSAYGKNPKIEDLLALVAANGRTLELLGDPTDTLAQFHQALFQLARDEVALERSKKVANKEELELLNKKFLTEEDRGKIRKYRPADKAIPTDLELQYEYAELDGDPFPRVKGGSSLLASLLDIPSLKVREKFHKKFHDEVSRSLEKIDLNIKLKSGYDMETAAENIEALETYLKDKSRIVDKTAKKEITAYKNDIYQAAADIEKNRSEQIQLSRDLDYLISEPQEFYKGSTLEEAKELRKVFFKRYFKNIDKFDYGKIEEYEYLEPFVESDNPTIEKREGKYAHEKFDASEIHTPFDVIQTFSRGRERFDTPTNRAMLTETEKMELENEAVRVIKKMKASEFTKKYGERFKGLKREDVLPALNDTSDLGSRYSSRVVQSSDASGSTLLKENELVLNQDSVKRQQSRQLFEELKTEIFKENIKKGTDRQDSIFRKNRTTIQKNELVISKEDVMENADPVSSTNVTAVDIAEYYLSGSNPVKQMERLEQLPSSKVEGKTAEGVNERKQLPGGLGEGLLVYIYPQFLASMYNRLGIKDWSPNIKSDKKFKWRLESGDLLFDGKPVESNLFIDDESRMSPEEMAILTEPIVQAVIDARGLDIKNEYDKNRDNLLQRNPLEGSEAIDERGEVRDDSGNQEAAQYEKSEALSREALDMVTQANLLRQIEKNPKALDKLDDATIAELVELPNLDKEIKNLLAETYAKRKNFKDFDRILLNEEPRTLNSDAGKPVSDRAVVFKVFTLMDKGAPLDKIIKLGSQWDERDLTEIFEQYKNKKSSLKTKPYKSFEAFDKDFSAAYKDLDNYKNFSAERKAIIEKGELVEDTLQLLRNVQFDRANDQSAKSESQIIEEFESLRRPMSAFPRASSDSLNKFALKFDRAFQKRLQDLGYISKKYRPADFFVPRPPSQLDPKPPLTEAEEAINKKVIDAFDEVEAKIKKDGTSPRTLNSDAGRILTSDVNPNLEKVGLLSRLGGDSELLKDFNEWKKSKKESIKEGSFKMNFVDRADPLKQANRMAVEALNAIGLPKDSPLYQFLDMRGEYYRYYGIGADAVEQSRLEYYEPLTDLMREYGFDEEKVGTYLTARAAPSRNLQIEAKAREVLSDMKREDALAEDTEQYKKIKNFFFDEEGNFIRYSGIETSAALRKMEEMEKDSRFVEFLQKYLPIYYSMNLDGIQELAKGGMINTRVVEEDGNTVSLDEVQAMKTAMSRFDFQGGGPDKYGNAYKSKVKLSQDIGNYSYSPLQGFEGETEQFFDHEEAWEEFGAGSNNTGRGFDQPKSQLTMNGAFGRPRGGERPSIGPDPKLVIANAFRQHTSNMLKSKKNAVAQSFGAFHDVLREIIYPNEERPEGATVFRDDPLLKDTFEQLQKLQQPENAEVLKKLKEEFEKIFDPKGYTPTEIKTMYQVEHSDMGSSIGVIRREMNSEFKNDAFTFTYRRYGQPKHIKLNGKTKEGMRMSDTMKNLKYESLPTILQGFNVVTRGMAQMFTSANLAFLAPNFFRDVGTAYIHLTEDDKKSMVKDALSFKTLGSFIKEIYKAERDIQKGINPNTANPEVKKLLLESDPKKILASGNRVAQFQYFKALGGKVGYFRHKSIPEQVRDIQKELKGKGGWTKRGWTQFWNIIDAMNTGIENSIRASTFWAAIKDNRSPEEAASIARNVTVDFNQKGNYTQTFGALYVFFGASVNSMHRFWTTFSRRSPKERAKIISGLAGAALILNLFNRLVDDDEDEEMPDYDTISTYKRDTNAILPVPGGLPGFFNDEKDTGYFSLPLPLGYNLFWTLGQVMGDMVAKNVFNRGGTGLIGGATRVQESFLNAFNPVGGASIVTAFTPTAVTPIAELWANTNFMNKPIRYADRPFEVPKPAHMQDPGSTPEHWTALSKAINNFMGGSDDVKGSLAGMLGGNPLMYNDDEDIKFDISGNQMKHFLYGYLGGPGMIADTMFGGLLSAAQGDSSVDNIGDIPVFNRFMRATTYGSATRRTYNSLRDAVKNAEKAVKNAKNVSPEIFNQVSADNQDLMKLSNAIATLDKQKNRMRRIRKQIESSKKLSDEQKTQRVDDIQKKELNLMVTVIKKAQSLGIS